MPEGTLVDRDKICHEIGSWHEIGSGYSTGGNVSKMGRGTSAGDSGGEGWFLFKKCSKLSVKIFWGWFVRILGDVNNWKRR